MTVLISSKSIPLCTGQRFQHRFGLLICVVSELVLASEAKGAEPLRLLPCARERSPPLTARSQRAQLAKHLGLLLSRSFLIATDRRAFASTSARRELSRWQKHSKGSIACFRMSRINIEASGEERKYETHVFFILLCPNKRAGWNLDKNWISVQSWITMQGGI